MKDYYKNEIGRLKDELRKVEEHEKNLELARTIRDLYDSYIEAGFTEEQAWEIFIAQVKRANN